MQDCNRIEMAYLAGAFDGDGSFSLCKKIENPLRSPLYYPLIQFGCKDSNLIGTMKNKFGGTFSKREKHIAKDGFLRNEFYLYKLEKRRVCKPFLEEIIPFLRIKKERAEEILNFIDSFPFIRGSKRLSQEVLLEKEKAYIKIKKMNSERNINSNLRRKKIEGISPDIIWPYIAGLMDTDGSFSININRDAPVLSLSMVDIRGIDFIYSTIKCGNVNVLKAKTCKIGFTYRWECKKNKDVKIFLENVIPFLRSKKENATTLLDFMNNKSNVKYRQGGTSPEELSLREMYHHKLMQLNKYGVYKPSLIDLEVQKQDDRAEGESHRERLNEMASVN